MRKTAEMYESESPGPMTIGPVLSMLGHGAMAPSFIGCAIGCATTGDEAGAVCAEPSI
jgi:hypothetical protein